MSNSSRYGPSASCILNQMKYGLPSPIQYNRKAVISLEQRKACKLHGVLTDFVCLSCSKESCS